MESSYHLNIRLSSIFVHLRNTFSAVRKSAPRTQKAIDKYYRNGYDIQVVSGC